MIARRSFCDDYYTAKGFGGLPYLASSNRVNQDFEEPMIQGDYFTGADILLTCETETDLSAQTALSIIVTRADASSKTYSATVVNFTQARASYPTADNTISGQISIQVSVTTPTFGTELSAKDTLFIIS